MSRRDPSPRPRSMRRRLHRRLPWAAWACVVGLLTAAALARAHQQFAPSTVNRYGKLVVSQAHGLRLFYTLMVGEVPAFTLRTQADRNHDGTLDRDEQAQLCTRLGAALQDGLSLWIDDQPQRLIWDTPQCALSGSAAQASDAVAALPIAMERSTSTAFPLPRGRARVVRYDDRVAMPPIGEVELRIEDGPDLRLLATWQGSAPPDAAAATLPPADTAHGDQPSAIQRVFQALGPPRSSMSDRSISLRVAAAQADPLSGSARRPSVVLLGLLGLLSLIAGGFVLALRARKSVAHSS